MKELRFGLVCYGGVSLAIYMHGITSELHNLVKASNAQSNGTGGRNPFPENTTEQCDEKTFSQQLTNDTASTGAQSGTHCDLVTAHGRAREQQICYVCARDQKNCHNRAQQHE